MKLYYGRISTLDGQVIDTQLADAAKHGIAAKHVHVDEGVSGYHVAPKDRTEWKRVEDKLSNGGTLYVRWLDRISRRYDELHRTMGRLMESKVKVVCTMNGMEFDGAETDPMKMAVRDAVLAFMAAQGQSDYQNRREMQAAGIAIAKKDASKYRGRPATINAAEVLAWKASEDASVRETARHFGIAVSTVSRFIADAKVAA